MNRNESSLISAGCSFVDMDEILANLNNENSLWVYYLWFLRSRTDRGKSKRNSYKLLLRREYTRNINYVSPEASVSHSQCREHSLNQCRATTQQPPDKSLKMQTHLPCHHNDNNVLSGFQTIVTTSFYIEVPTGLHLSSPLIINTCYRSADNEGPRANISRHAGMYIWLRCQISPER